jgi:SAM-dependent methyltransferase
MKRLLERLLERRAEALARRITPFLADCGSALDIGCGTGHNAAALRALCPQLAVCEADVVDMKVVGDPPVLIHDKVLPFPQDRFDCGLLLFVLHYPADPESLLREAHRIIRQRLLILQATWGDALSRWLLRGREWLQGAAAFHVARRAGLIRPCPCPLRATQLLDRPHLEELFRASGWTVQHRQEDCWPGTRLSRDLYVLEKA